tara:strand:+ start:241 stop:693 length:453 start_codon:yes stop_codon:yes gene_type:complete
MLGNMLQGRDQQWVASKDRVTNTWRILDTWHDSLKAMDVEDDIPDDSPAVTILTEGAFISLIREAARLGILENAAFGTGEAELEAIILDKDQEITNLKQELVDQQAILNAEVVRNSTHTEGYDLKAKAMDNILKLAAIGDMSNINIISEN